jgi:hypothetical protein
VAAITATLGQQIFDLAEAGPCLIGHIRVDGSYDLTAEIDCIAVANYLAHPGTRVFM